MTHRCRRRSHLGFCLFTFILYAALLTLTIIVSTDFLHDAHPAFELPLVNSKLSKRDDPNILPPHYFRLAKKDEDVIAFQDRYNLTLVTYTPQDAALLPGWPQAFLQYFLLNPSIIQIECCCICLTPEVVDVVQVLLAAPCLIAWIIAFGKVESTERATSGWVSVMGWLLWINLLVFILIVGKAEGSHSRGRVKFGVFAMGILAVFQWGASFAAIIQRWTGSIGTIAYQITDLHGCTPYDGLTYLQAAARAKSYRIIQTTTFATASVAGVVSIFCHDMHSDMYFWIINGDIKAAATLVALAELIYSAVIASKGKPLVVSGNCLLVELSPRLGYLDSDISTFWKALAGFMGF